ncbi:MAG: hypothetical protein K2X60_09280 [Xanthobacteraceae bacterium]|nr:hypothetical protein [Xanthobacteraceae bacterium]
MSAKFARAKAEAAGDGLHYAYKASLAGTAHRFELRDNGLWWSVFGKSETWPYETIAKINLSYRPNAMHPQRFRADIEAAGGKRMKIYSTTWQTAALMLPQDHAYRVFVAELHQRVAPQTIFTAGIARPLYVTGLCFIAAVLAAIAALAVRGLLVSQFAGVLFLIGFGVLFVWQVGGFFRRNRPGTYTADNLPQQLLP